MPSGTKKVLISTENNQSIPIKKLLITYTQAPEMLEPMEYLGELYPGIVVTDLLAIVLQDALCLKRYNVEELLTETVELPLPIKC